MKIRFLTFSLIVLSFYSCKSREFKSVSVADEVASEVSAEDKQELEETRTILAKGNLSFQKGEFGEAIAKAKEANLKVETAEGYALLGASEYQLGEYAAAKDAYELGNRLDPDNEKLLIGLGTVESTLGDYEEAIQIYQKLVRMEPDEPVYKYKVGTLLKLQKKFEESYVTLKPLEDEKNFPYPVELLNQLGDVCLELKKYDEAEAYFAKAEKLQPDLKSAQNAKQSTKVAALIQKGNDAIAKKNYDLAVEEYKKATDLQPTNASLYSFLGNAYLLKGALAESEIQFKKAISLQDNFTNAYLGLCNVQIKKSNFSECLKVAESGLKKSPKNAELKNKLGICEWKWGQTQKALLSFQDAAAWDKNFFEPRINLAYLLLDQGRNEEAIDALKKAETHIHADKDQIKKALAIAESQMYIVEGDSYLRQGKRKQALELYGKALGRSPGDPAPHNAFAKAYYAFNEYKKSESSYLEALRNDQNSLMAIQGLARVYARTGDSKKETEYVNRLQKLSQNDPYVAITLGRIAEDSKKFDDAENIYMGLLKKFPNHDAVHYRLGNLFYKRAVDENDKENYNKAMEYVQKSKKYSKEIPEIVETEKTIKENLRFAEIIPFVREGNKAYDKKRFDEAIVAYQKAYDKVAKPSLLVKVAECYMSKGEEEKGISILEKAARDNKDQASSFHEGIYAFFYKKGEIGKAEEGFNKLISEKPDSFYSYYMLGLISMKKKDYETSVTNLDKSILLNGSYAPANVAKGLAFYKTGKPDQAKKEFERARSKDGEFSLSSYNLAIAYFNEDLISESKNILEALKKSSPDFLEGEIQLAYIYFKEGKLNEAEDSILNVLKEERTAEALYAYHVILNEKTKKTPSDKLNSKIGAIQKEIWQNYPDTKYARMLPTDKQEEGMIVTEVALTGTPMELPLLYPNRVIINYGESIVGLERDTKEVSWKLGTPIPFKRLLAGKQIFAFRSGMIQKIYPDTGKLGTSVDLKSNDEIISAEILADKIFLLTENQKSKQRFFQVMSVDGEPIFNLNEKDIYAFGLMSSGNLILIRDKKKEFTFTTLAKDNWSPTAKETSFLKKDTSEKMKVSGCLANSCLIQNGNTFLEANATGKIVSLPAHGSYLNSFVTEDSIQVKTSDKLLVWKGESKWNEVTSSHSDFKYNLADTILEAKAKEIMITKGSNKKSFNWNPEKDNKRLSTITVD
jgi:tetratricopeptide (TPR) repeat protein